MIHLVKFYFRFISDDPMIEFYLAYLGRFEEFG
jgi:hypothetical protein